jgi:hypothetical protein
MADLLSRFGGGGGGSGHNVRARGPSKKKEPATLVFDGTTYKLFVTNEQSEHTSSVVDHAVEEGANVSDHVRTEPDRVTLQIFISNTPVRDTNGFYGMAVAGIELKVPRKEKALYPTPGSLTSAAFDAISSAIEGPEEWKALVLQSSQPFNAVKHEIGLLLDWKERGIVGDVVLEHRTYRSMVITGVSTSKTGDTGDGIEATIELRKIRLVEVTSTTLPIPSETRGHTMKAKGRQPTEALPEARKKSTAKVLEGGHLGLRR